MTQGNKDKIITEIERLKADYVPKVNEEYRDFAKLLLDIVVDSINSLPAEQPSEDLEEAASRYAKEEYNHKSPATLPNRCIGCYSPLMYAFKAGANWQKEQMMKSGVDGCSIYRNKYTKQNILNGLSVTCDAIQQFKDGDKVKVIIVKEVEQ